MSELKPSHEVQGIVCRPQIQDCIAAQIWGRLQKKFCSIEGSQKHVVSVTLNGRGLTQPGLFLELAKLSNWWRRTLVRLVTKNLIILHLLDHTWRWWLFSTEEQPSLQHSIDLGFMTTWQDSILSSVKTHLEFAKKHLKDPQTMKSKILWSDKPQFQASCLKETRLCSTCRVPSQN